MSRSTQDEGAFRYIGKERARPDAPDKAMGKAHYIHEVQRPGMLYGKIKFSEQAHARIVSIDTSRAERLPGVHAVITGYNTPEVQIGFLRDNVALKMDKVRQYRDEVAAVAATDPDIAAEAVELIKVEYDPLPGVFDVEAALAPGAPLVHEADPRGKPLTSNLMKLAYHHESGDMEAGRRQSRYMVEGSFSTPLIQQSCMGTAGCVAEFDSRDNLTVWAKTQIPFLAQRDFNNALAAMGLKGKNVRVIVPAMGGGFGSGLDTHAYEYISILLAHRTNRPVKVLYDRREEFAYLSPRQSAQVTVAQGCDEQGRLTFRDIRVMQDNGAYTSWGATFPTVMMIPATSLYVVPNVRFSAELVYTNNTYCQAMRGYGNPEVTWALESNLDELAEAAGMDAYDLRKINCNRPGEITPMGLKVGTCGLQECLETTFSGLKWMEKRRQQRGKARGVGMASLMHVGGSGRIYRSDASGIILKFDDFGNINVSHGGVEMGQGLHSVIGLGIAEALGVRPEDVVMNQTDTGTCPWDVGTHASRGAFTALNAAIDACNQARALIFEAAVDLYPGMVAQKYKKHLKAQGDAALAPVDLPDPLTADDFQLQDGLLAFKGAPDRPWLTMSLGSMIRAMHFRQGGKMLTVEAFYDPPNELPDWGKGKGNMSATYAYGTQGVEVEVDTDTGEVKILNLVAAHDVGTVLNPQTLRGQAYGALAQGLGYAMYEQVITNKGRVMNPDFRDYKIPTACEMDFPIQMAFIETDAENGPFGAKGVGEPGLVPTAPAIGNAVYDAVGVRIRDLPITPEKVLAALKAKKTE